MGKSQDDLMVRERSEVEVNTDGELPVCEC